VVAEKIAERETKKAEKDNPKQKAAPVKKA
jgi:hypothetical protein